jgi:uncharacterized oligopeptide transporter (OPT) family protein
VLIAGEKGGDFAKTAYLGLAFAFGYAILQKVFHVIAETPAWVTKQSNKFFPSATVNGEITPEYMGVGYIIGPKIAGVLVAGGVLAWLGLIPLLASVVPAETTALQLVKLGYLKDLLTPGGPGGWDPTSKTFADTASAIYRAYVRQIGAGAVAAGGFITLIKTIPTIISSFKSSFGSMNKVGGKVQEVKRTDQDLSIKTVVLGSLSLVILMAVLPQLAVIKFCLIIHITVFQVLETLATQPMTQLIILITKLSFLDLQTTTQNTSRHLAELQDDRLYSDELNVASHHL